MLFRVTNKVGVRRGKPLDYQSMIDAMRSADVTSKGEISVRFTIILCALIVSTIATDDPRIAYSLSLYVAVNLIYNVRLSSRKLKPTQVNYIVLVVLFVIGASTFAATVAYIFSFGTPAMLTLGAAGGISQAMYNLSRHRKYTFTAFWDMMLITTLIVFYGFFSMTLVDSLTEKSVLFVSVIGASVYFLYTQVNSIEFHQDLSDARSETIQTQKMRAVGQLTAGVAHDFNNLLTVIRGNIELAELSATKDDLDERLGDAKAAADQAAVLVSQLLTFSHKANLQANYVEVTEFIQEFQRVLVRILPATVRVDVSMDANLKHLYCDANLLQSSLLNLVINACDAMQENGRILFHCKVAPPDAVAAVSPKLAVTRRYGMVRVIDNGPGFPDEILQNAAEPFFTTKPVGEGSGLGLSSVKGFAEQSGGGLQISSPKHGGAIVAIFLPLEPIE